MEMARLWTELTTFRGTRAICDWRKETKERRKPNRFYEPASWPLVPKSYRFIEPNSHTIHPLIDRATKRASKYLGYIIVTLISWSHIRSSKHISSSFHWLVHPLFACSNTLRLKYGNDLFQRHVNMSNRRPTTRVYVHVLQKIITSVWTRSQLIGTRDKPYSLLWCCRNHGSGCLGTVPWKIIGWCQKRSTHKHSFLESLAQKYELTQLMGLLLIKSMRFLCAALLWVVTQEVSYFSIQSSPSPFAKSLSVLNETQAGVMSKY